MNDSNLVMEEEIEAIDCNDDMSEERMVEVEEEMPSLTNARKKAKKDKEKKEIKPRSNLWDHAKKIMIEGEWRIKYNYCPKNP